MRIDGGRESLRHLAAAAGLVVLVLVSAATAPPGRLPLDLTGRLLLVLAAMVTLAGRRAPRVVLGVVTGCMLAYQVRGYPGVAPAVPVMVGLYCAAKAGHRWAAGAAVGTILVSGIATENAFAGAGGPAPDVSQRWILLVGWMIAAAVAGELSRQRGIHLDHVEQRAADAERTREETARRRADEERLRIARELHDSLTHSISIIKVQAGVAVHLARKRDEPVPEALVAIQEASREAMRELRATLEVLRADDGPLDADLDRLDRLVDGARKIGLSVTVTVRGRPRSLPPSVDRAAYRIVQEALTNVTRHSGAAIASVQLDYRDDELAVRVDDDGVGGDGAEVLPGRGLLGMRERVTALGGSLHAGPSHGSGFSVHATLPLQASPPVRASSPLQASSPVQASS